MAQSTKGSHHTPGSSHRHSSSHGHSSGHGQSSTHRQSSKHREHDTSPRYSNADWEAKEAHYQRELGEAKARATQMEKTMRWWSDCTSSWREKWSKVRTERNRAREECKMLKTTLDSVTKDLMALKTQKIEQDHQLIDLKRDNEKLLTIGESLISGDLGMDDGVEIRKKKDYSPDADIPKPEPRQRASLDSHKFSNVDHVLANKLSELRIRLDEAGKGWRAERDQNAYLQAKVETLTAELHNSKMDLPHSDRTMGSTGSSHSEVERLQNELQDEVAIKQVLEEKITELRSEVEKLKSENTVQWSKRELLETENIAILRENKRLYRQISELEEVIQRLDWTHKGRPRNSKKTSSSPNSGEISSTSSEANLIGFDKTQDVEDADDEGCDQNDNVDENENCDDDGVKLVVPDD